MALRCAAQIPIPEDCDHGGNPDQENHEAAFAASGGSPARWSRTLHLREHIRRRNLRSFTVAWKVRARPLMAPGVPLSINIVGYSSRTNPYN